MLLGAPVGVVLGDRTGVFLGCGAGVVLGHGTGVACGRGFPLGVVDPGPPMDASSRFGVLVPLPCSGVRFVVCRSGDDLEHVFILEIILEICEVSL